MAKSNEAHLPKQRFTVYTITRQDIAEGLNLALEDTDGEADEVMHFAADDERLTDEVCQGIADDLWDAIVNADDDAVNAAERETFRSSVARFV